MSTTRPDITLALLGGFILERAGTPVSGRATQRRRLALLALLGGSPGFLLSRDRIIGLLWPEAGAAAARHLLADAVYEVRRALGDDAILSRGDDLALNVAVVDTDVAQFDAAIAATELERALALYRGDFAAGLFVSGSAEFQHWLDATRARHHSAFREVLERLAASRAADSPARAAEAWHRLALDDVTDQRLVLEAMKALAAVGRRGLALQLATSHEQRMRVELGAEPAAAVISLRAQMSQEPGVADSAKPWLSEAQPPAVGTELVPDRRRPAWPRAATVILAVATATALIAYTQREPTVADQQTLARARLLASWPDRPVSGLAHAAAAGTASSAALAAYLQGEHAWRRGRVLRAVEHFERATTSDSTFALAWYRLSQASIAADLPNMVTRKADSLVFVLAPRTSPRERLLLKAYEYFRQGSGEGAEPLYRTLLAQYPDCTEAWLQLGETLFHYNPPRGRPIAEARAAFERALSLDPDNWIAKWHLSLLAASREDGTTQVRLLDQLALQDSIEPTQAAELSVLRRFARGDYRSPDVVRTVADLDELWLFRLIWVTSAYQRDLEATEILAQALASPRLARHSRMLGLGVLEALYLARGDWPATERIVRETATATREPLFLLDARVTAALAPVPGWSRQSVTAVRNDVQSWRAPPAHSRIRHFWLGLLQGALGDSAAALASARALERLGGDAALIRAQVALEAGRPAEAVALLQRPAPPMWFGLAATSSWGAGTFERYMRARALVSAGKTEEAALWLRSLEEYVVADLAYAGLVQRQWAEIAERRGDAAEAVRRYRDLISLWNGDNPALAAVRDTLGRRVAALDEVLKTRR